MQASEVSNSKKKNKFHPEISGQKKNKIRCMHRGIKPLEIKEYLSTVPTASGILQIKINFPHLSRPSLVSWLLALGSFLIFLLPADLADYRRQKSNEISSLLFPLSSFLFPLSSFLFPLS
jgi:hypothetical protein